MSLSQTYEEKVRKFSFLAQHHSKAELYRYSYIFIFIFNVFLDIQCIVSLGDFQRKILNWSILLLLSPHTSIAGKRGQEL